MSWCRLEDDMDENRKIRRLSHEAFRLYWIAVTYARRQETSGRLHLDDISDLCARHRIKGMKGAIKELLHVPTEYEYEHGCWEEVGPGIYQIHDHEEYNPPTSKERMRRKRERDRPPERDGPEPNSDGPVTSHAVTDSVTGDVNGDGQVTHSDAPRAQERAGYPNPVPEPVTVTTELRSSVTPPVVPLPEVVSPTAATRAGQLESGCSELLKRTLRTDERPVLLGWAALERDGAPVPLAEILALARYLLGQPTRDGTPPGTLRYCDASVLALARAPWAGPDAARGPGLPAAESNVVTLRDPELLRPPTAEEREVASRRLPELRAKIAQLRQGTEMAR